MIRSWAVVAVLVGACLSPCVRAAADGPPSGGAGATAGDGAVDAQGATATTGHHRTPWRGSDGQATTSPPFVIITKDCGPRVLNGHQLRDTQTSDPCAAVQAECGVLSVRGIPKDPHATTVAVIKTWIRGPNKGLRIVTKNCNARTAVPRVTPLMAREEIEKQVPKPTVGLAPPGGRTLVNEQTVMWVDTPADRTLETVTLLGVYRVALRIHVHRVRWSFGDGDGEVTDDPGVPYRMGEHCKTVTCPGHFGHTYTRTGRMMIRAQVVWSGQFAVNGGAWQDIDGTVSGAEQAADVEVIEGRGVLVPDPGSR